MTCGGPVPLRKENPVRLIIGRVFRTVAELVELTLTIACTVAVCLMFYGFWLLVAALFTA